MTTSSYLSSPSPSQRQVATISKSLRFTWLLGIMSLGLIASPCARAELLIYEGFEGYATGRTIVGQAASSNTIGLAGSYQSLTHDLRAVSTGLTFGRLRVSGGALQHNYSNVQSTIGIAIDSRLASTTGTVYSSYLVHVTKEAALTSGILGIGIGETPTSTSADRGLNSWALNDSNRNPGIAYPDASTRAYGSAPKIEFNTTYIVISRFTNVGTMLSNQNPGVGTLWVLTEDQFEYFAAIGFDDTKLEAATKGMGATNVYNTVTQTVSGGEVSLGALQMTAAWSDGLILDEIRWGTSLDSVLPTIPEAKTFSVLMSGLIVLLIMARRRR